MKNFLLVLIFFVTASAQNTDNDIENTGNEYLTGCSAYFEDVNRSSGAFTEGLCIGYLQGVLDGFNGGAIVSDPKGKNVTFCLPASGTRGQNVRIFLKYLKDNPQRLHLSTSALIVAAAHEAFPCK